MRLFALLTAALVAAVSAYVPPAAAHDEIPGFRNVVDEVEPPLPDGIRLAVVVSAADQLVAENRTESELVVLASTGEPFLRIGPGGVEANLRSPDWYRTASPEGTVPVPDGADPAAAPNWVRVASEPAWGWFDHRLHRAPLRAPPRAAGAVVRLESWTVPMRLDGRDLVVRGHREFSRPKGSIRARVTAAPEALTVAALDGTVPALSVTADAGVDVRVLGADGRPFILLDGAGAEVDVAHPSWRLMVASEGGALAETGPRWERRNTAPTVTWLEERLRYPEKIPPADVVDAGRESVLLRWRVPVVVDGRPAAIEGTTSWVPIAARAREGGGVAEGTGSGDLDLRRVGGVAAVLALAALYLLARRGRRGSLRERGPRRG